MDIWNTLVIQPFAWLLLTLYNFTMSYGLAIILFAIVAKLILLFFAAKGKRSMLQQQRMEPKRKELELKFKNDKQKYQEALMQLYQKEGVSMYGGCLWSLLPFPVLLALYSVVREPLTNLMKLTKDQVGTLQSFFDMAASKDAYIQMDMAQKVHDNFAAVQNLLPDAPGLININFDFFGLNLAANPELKFEWLLLIPILSAATAFLSGYLTQKFSGVKPQGNMKVMMFMSPAISLWFGFIMPAAMGVYWIVGNLLSIVQEYFLTKHYTKVLDAQDAHRQELEARRKAAEEKMKEENRLRRLEEQAQNKSQAKKYRITNGPKPKGKK